MGKVEIWRDTDDSTPQLIHCSIKCNGLLFGLSKMCGHCATIKHHSSRTLISNVNAATSNETSSIYKRDFNMSTEEKLQKLKHVKVNL